MGAKSKLPMTQSGRPVMPILERRYSPERLARLLDAISKNPRVNQACAVARVTPSMKTYWLKRSEIGKPGDGFDVTWEGEAMRFHEAYSLAKEHMIQTVEDAYVQGAMEGFKEVQVYRGRVKYKVDRKKASAMLRANPEFSWEQCCEACPLEDDFGSPIPEAIYKQDPEVMREVLRANRRDVWGKHENVDVTHRGGVLVVGVRSGPVDLEKLAAAEPDNSKTIDVEFVTIEEDDK